MAIQPNINNFIAQNSADGGWWRSYYSNVGTATKTLATTTSGYITGRRFPNPISVNSSMGSNGLILTSIVFQQMVDVPTAMGAFLEVDMGTINMNTGTFTDGSAMPSRRIVGNTSTTAMAAPLVVLVSEGVTATAPVVTITYDNQAGTGSRSAALTLSNSPVDKSVFVVNPHFQSGDTAVQDVTNITKSAGTAGTMKVYGLYPLQVGNSGNGMIMNPAWSTSIPKIVLEASDTIAFYDFGSNQANISLVAMLYGVGDTA